MTAVDSTGLILFPPRFLPDAPVCRIDCGQLRPLAGTDKVEQISARRQRYALKRDK